MKRWGRDRAESMRTTSPCTPVVLLNMAGRGGQRGGNGGGRRGGFGGGLGEVGDGG